MKYAVELNSSGSDTKSHKIITLTTLELDSFGWLKFGSVKMKRFYHDENGSEELMKIKLRIFLNFPISKLNRFSFSFVELTKTPKNFC